MSQSFFYYENDPYTYKNSTQFSITIDCQRKVVFVKGTVKYNDIFYQTTWANFLKLEI